MVEKIHEKMRDRFSNLRILGLISGVIITSLMLIGACEKGVRRDPTCISGSLETSTVTYNGNNDLNDNCDSGNGSVGNPYLFEDKTYSTTTGNAFQLYNIDAFFVFRNCTFMNGTRSVYMSNVKNGVFENCTFWNSTSYTLYLRGVNDTAFINCSIHDGSQGIYTQDACNNISLVGNEIYGNTQYGVFVSDPASNFTVTGNEIHGNGQNGWRAGELTGSYFMDNWFHGNGGTDFTLNTGSNWNIIMNNTCESNGSSGISVSGSNHVSILGNTATGHDQPNRAGIYVGSSFNVSIIDNEVFNNDRGIVVQDGSSYCLVENNTVGFNGDSGMYFYNDVFQITIRNNIVYNSTLRCIWLYKNVTHCVLDQNEVTNSSVGIMLHDDCMFNIIKDCEMHDNSNGAATSNWCSNNTFSGNYFHDNSNGIWINTACSNNSIVDNQLEYHTNGLFIEGGTGHHILNNNIQHCTQHGVYYRSVLDGKIRNNTIIDCTDHGILVDFSSRENEVSLNTITNVEEGIKINDNSRNNTIAGNFVNGSFRGISITHSDNNSIIGNDLDSNTQHGMYVTFSENNTITGNLITGNDVYGIFLSSLSHGNVVENNSIENNTNHGIVLQQVNGTLIVDNNLAGNHIGVYISILANNTEILNNTINNNTLGINATTGMVEIIDNVIMNNTEIGVFLISLDDGVSRVRSNTIISNGNNGIWLFNTSNVIVSWNKVFNNSGYGILIDDSSANNITYNNVYWNFPPCILESGTSSGNIIENNYCMPPGPFLNPIMQNHPDQLIVSIEWTATWWSDVYFIYRSTMPFSQEDLSTSAPIVEVDGVFISYNDAVPQSDVYYYAIVAGNETINSTISNVEMVTVDLLPVANIDAPRTAITGEIVTFNSTGFDGDNPATYSWDFGDGNFSVEENPQHVYYTEDSYTVFLIVTDADGDNSTVSFEITVNAPTSPKIPGIPMPLLVVIIILGLNWSSRKMGQSWTTRGYRDPS